MDDAKIKDLKGLLLSIELIARIAQQALEEKKFAALRYLISDIESDLDKIQRL